MTQLHQQRCFHHSLREAAARCPECGRFFCRECITEHDGRVMCATCLRTLAQAPRSRRAGFRAVARTGQFSAGVITVWLVFYLLGRLLVSLPDSFHEGTLWTPTWMDEGDRTSEKE